jgi:hypothetical protein
VPATRTSAPPPVMPTSTQQTPRPPSSRSTAWTPSSPDHVHRMPQAGARRGAARRDRREPPRLLAPDSLLRGPIDRRPDLRPRPALPDGRRGGIVPDGNRD